MIRFCLALTFSLLAVSRLGAAELSVVSTIKPLQFIAAAVLAEGDSSEVLGSSAMSPHHSTLRPSERLALQEADIILWIGDDFEIELAQFIGRMSADTRVISAMALPGITLLDYEGDSIAHHDHEDHGDHGQHDPHLWLDTDNARTIALALADAASTLNPGAGATYAQNAKRFAESLDALDTVLTQRLAGAGAKAEYVVYHNAFQYFERRHGLSHALYLVDDTHIEPSARHIMQTRRQLDRMQPQCLFAEPDASVAILNTLLLDIPITLVEVDLLGQNIDSGADAYVTLVDQLAEHFSGCLNY